MNRSPILWTRIRKFCRAEDGTQIVEFAILLPLMLLLFAVIIEGGRLMWSFQATNSGVRDASRYLARVAPADICTTGGSVSGYTTKLTDMVEQSSSGHSFFPVGITINSVSPTVTCYTGGFRLPSVAVAQVSADLTVTFPFKGVFEFMGMTLGTVNTTVTDQSRIFGT